MRGAIFDRLQAEVVGARVLDLFAGTGALAIEALSRGAAQATLVEQHPGLSKFLLRQIDALALRDRATVIGDDARRFLTRCGKSPGFAPFDLVLVDPPYAELSLYEAVLAGLVDHGCLVTDAVVVIEYEKHRGRRPALAIPPALSSEAIRDHGQTALEFLRYTPAHRSVPMTTHPLAINSLARAIKPSATLAMSARAGELAAAGRKIYNFSAGQPDFAPPAAITKAVTDKLIGAPVGYAPVPGFPALRDAVAAELSDFHGIGIGRNQVVVSCGAKHSLANLFLTTLSPGDEVVFGAPYWVSYPEMVALAGGVATIIDCPRSQNYKLTPEQLREAVGPRTKLLLLNSPSNPTGMAYSAAELRALAQVLAERAPQTWILSDDIYRKLHFGADGQASIVRACKGIAGIEDQIVLVDGVSKSHAMTGWRIGFLVAPEPVAKAVTAIQGQMTSGACTPAQWAALAATVSPEANAEVLVMRDRFAERRALMVAGLRAGGVELVEPDGAFYVFPDFSSLCGPGRRFADDLALASYLLEDHGLATVPGSAFGAPGHLRLSFACSNEEIEAGTELLRKAL